MSLLLLPNCLHFNKRSHDFCIILLRGNKIKDSRELAVTQIKVKHIQIEFALIYLNGLRQKSRRNQTATTFVITNTLEKAIKVNKDKELAFCPGRTEIVGLERETRVSAEKTAKAVKKYYAYAALVSHKSQSWWDTPRKPHSKPLLIQIGLSWSLHRNPSDVTTL